MVLEWKSSNALSSLKSFHGSQVLSGKKTGPLNIIYEVLHGWSLDQPLSPHFLLPHPPSPSAINFHAVIQNTLPFPECLGNVFPSLSPVPNFSFGCQLGTPLFSGKPAWMIQICPSSNLSFTRTIYYLSNKARDWVEFSTL